MSWCLGPHSSFLLLGRVVRTVVSVVVGGTVSPHVFPSSCSFPVIILLGSISRASPFGARRGASFMGISYSGRVDMREFVQTWAWLGGQIIQQGFSPYWVTVIVLLVLSSSKPLGVWFQVGRMAGPGSSLRGVLSRPVTVLGRPGGSFMSTSGPFPFSTHFFECSALPPRFSRFVSSLVGDSVRSLRFGSLALLLAR